MASTTVFVTRPIPEAGLEMLVQAFGVDGVHVRSQDTVIGKAELLESARGVAGLLSMVTDRIDGELLDAAGPGLKVVANMGVGYDNFQLDEMRRRGVVPTNTPDVLTEATADLAWTLILGAARRAGEGERLLRGGRWVGWGPRQLLGMSVQGRVLGIFGMGRIGRAVARRARGFDMSVLYCNSSALSPEEECALNARRVDKEELITGSDVISLHCPLTPDTRHAFARAEFERMKPTVILVNTARGPVVKEDDLAWALREERIFAAGIDVYEFEPRVSQALQAEERALLLPHLGSATVDARNAMARTAAENIVAVLQGRAAPNRIA